MDEKLIGFGAFPRCCPNSVLTFLNGHAIVVSGIRGEDSPTSIRRTNCVILWAIISIGTIISGNL
jgi:hypothetical protein